MREGERLCGYKVKRIVELAEIHSTFIQLEHIATGARHIHIQCLDSENAFSVAFKTVPRDSTGAAHILEHTVLCGSKKFPVRDPFFSMLKRSLSTFMNAFTASDWTLYPFATQNRKDFFNLLAVYLDAVFFPILNPLNFRQEGHRLEIEKKSEGDPHCPLVYKGVVYSEMKGAMSSPDQVMNRCIHQALYPSTTYRYNYGGDPSEIPHLTYRQLKQFHRTHYHPSNAFFYTYGNMPIEDILYFIQKRALRHFERIQPKTDVPPQPRWKKPRQKTYYYPFSKKEDPSKKCQVCVAWLMADIQEQFEVLALIILEHILLGNAASPLRKALIDSGLGTALSDGSGFVPDNRDTLFSCGLKDVTESCSEEIEKIIFYTLRCLVQKGIDRDLIESAIHQLEFHRKEITNHPYPYGIKLMFSITGTWIHGGDPVRILKFESDIKTIREQLRKGRFFEERIDRYFLKNQHRVRLTLVPDQETVDKENRRIAAELKEIWNTLKPSDIKKLKRQAKALQLLQESEEDLSVLPTLEINDIPPSVQVIEEFSACGNVPAVCYRQPTSRIFYFSAVLGVGSLDENLLPLVPFFCHAFSKSGTKLYDYVEMAKRIDTYTGGITLSAHARTRFGAQGQCIPFIAANGKCLDRNEAKMFDILQELLFNFDLSDLTRLKHLLLEYRSGMESMIIHNGHRLAVSLALRNFSSTCALSEIWYGVHQLKTLKEITQDLTEDRLMSLSGDLDRIARCLINRNNIKMSIIGEEPLLKEALGPINVIENRLQGAGSDGFNQPKIPVKKHRIREGWSTATAVSFVARAFPAVRMEHEDAPALCVISKLLRSLFLHREIREKGGAYGGFALYNPEDGTFSFVSYRDPHIIETLNAYDGAIRFIRSADYTEEDIKEAIIQVCSNIDRPDPPGPAARKAFLRKILSISDDARRRFKQGVLAVTHRQVQSVAEKYFDPTPENNSVVVISNDERLTEANENLTDHPFTLKRI
ncbi:MAG: insulinase family protein [Deltaproteobacteria bacterium]|nr:insulinase family protein [Deltaproteobacteria bacterium]